MTKPGETNKPQLVNIADDDLSPSFTNPSVVNIIENIKASNFDDMLIIPQAQQSGLDDLLISQLRRESSPTDMSSENNDSKPKKRSRKDKDD